MRVLHVITELKIGGESVHLARVVRSLPDIQHRVASLATNLDPKVAPHDVRADLEGAGANVVDLGIQRGRPFSVATAAARLFRLVRRERPDVIHATLIHANLLAQPLGVLGYPVICTYVGTQPWTHRWQQVIERYTARRVAIFLTNAKAVADVLHRRGVASDRIRVLPYGVDASYFSPEGPSADVGDGDVILGIGRLVPEKGFSALLDAVVALPTSPRVVILGQGPLREELAAKAIKSGVQLALPGAVRDVRPYIRRANVVAFASVHEGISNVLLEALAMGRPVVATAVPGHREVIEDRHNGLLVPIGDTYEFTAALKRALANGARLGLEGRKMVVARFGWEAYVARREALYELVARRGSKLASRA
jgi:glycosyltransferase involved in cell wall biosynthesis